MNELRSIVSKSHLGLNTDRDRSDENKISSMSHTLTQYTITTSLHVNRQSYMCLDILSIFVQ